MISSGVPFRIIMTEQVVTDSRMPLMNFTAPSGTSEAGFRRRPLQGLRTLRRRVPEEGASHEGHAEQARRQRRRVRWLWVHRLRDVLLQLPRTLRHRGPHRPLETRD